jgi:hypothetical protein
VPDAQCQSEGFDEFQVAMNWLVLHSCSWGAEARTRKTGGRNSQWITSWLALTLGKWKNVLDAQCQSGGFDEFLVAMNWLVLQWGGRSTCTQKRVVEFAMVDLLAGPCWPLLWALV